MINRHNFFPILGDVLFNNRVKTLAVIFMITAYFAVHIPAVKMLSDFADLLPQDHPYIELHNDIRDTFGGANVVLMMVEVEEGDIFTQDTLSRINRLTLAMDEMYAVNHNLITSMTHRNTRKLWLKANGTIKSSPIYDPFKESFTESDLEDIKRNVITSGHVYGLLVAPDLKSAIIKATLLEGQLDYGRIFSELQEIRNKESVAGTNIYVTGHPVLVGWVSSYSQQILQIFLYTILIVMAILVLYMRRLYGILLPMVGMTLTSIWGVGFMGVVGFNLDPLMLVVPFLISARALSHGIQKVERYYLELAATGCRDIAARNTFNSLFRPGGLAIVADASALFLIGLGSVPINDKMAIYASFWAVTMLVTVLVAIPMMLALLPQPKIIEQKHSISRSIFPKMALVTSTPKRSKAVLWTCLVIAIISAGLSSKVEVGEPEPGSPLLYNNHDYNISSQAINESYPGSEELFIIARTEKEGDMRRPDVLHALNSFQQYMMQDPSLGGTKGVNNLVAQVSQVLRNDDPRWQVIPTSEKNVGGLMYAYLMSAPVQGALQPYVDEKFQRANIVFYYKDHTGETIRRAIHMAKQWIDEVGKDVPGFELVLAGGTVGVTAAINEEAYETNVIVVPAVLLLIFCFTYWFYNTTQASFMMLVSMGFATILTYACMGILGMGLNVNTVPMIAVGIGLGVDYAIYMMDRIKEEMLFKENLQEAIVSAVSTTGVAIALTATTLVGGIIMWVFMSDLRFQADSAKLLIIMLILAASSAMFLIPAWVDIFKPKFITDAKKD